MVGYQSDTSMDIHGIFMIVSPNILNNIIYICTGLHECVSENWKIYHQFVANLLVKIMIKQ